MLSDRTIRNHIKAGRLKGRKIDRVWTFTAEDFEAFISDSFIKQSIQIKADSILNDFIINRKKSEALICVVYDRPEDDPMKAQVFCSAVISEIDKAKSINNMVYRYDKGMIRITLIGKPETVSSLLLVLYQL